MSFSSFSIHDGCGQWLTNPNLMITSQWKICYCTVEYLVCIGSLQHTDKMSYLGLFCICRVLDPTSFSKFIKGRLPYNSDNDVAEEIASPRMNRVSSVGQELDWIEPSFHHCNPRMLQYRGYDRVYDAFHLLHTDPSIQVP